MITKVRDEVNVDNRQMGLLMKEQHEGSLQSQNSCILTEVLDVRTFTRDQLYRTV